MQNINLSRRDFDELKIGYLEMFDQFDINLVVTLKTMPGYQATIETMTGHLKRMDAMVAREMLSRNWYLKPDHMRIQGVYVLEHGKSRTFPHWHGILQIPNTDLERYTESISENWGRKSWKIWSISKPEEMKKYSLGVGYLLKELTPETTDKIVFTKMLRN